MHVSKYARCFDIDDRHSLLLSSLTGAADMLDVKSRNAWDDLVTSGGKAVDQSFVSTLQERGYIFPSQQTEDQLFTDLENAFHLAHRNGLLRLAICPTYQCNLACKYCYEGQLPQTSNAALAEEDVLRLFQAIDSTYSERSQRVSIELTGGEPLLPKNKAVVERIFAESVRRGHFVGIVSNGVCLASHFADLLLQYSKNISFVQLTLDGPPDIHDVRRVFASGAGTSEHVTASVDFLVAHKIPVRLRVNIDSSNVSHLPRLAEIISRRGWLENDCLGCDVAPVLDHRGDSKYPYLTPEPELMKEVSRLRSCDSRVRKVFRFRLFRVLQHISSVLEGGEGFPSPCFQYCEANSPNFFVFGSEGFIYACGEAVGNPELAIGQFLPDHEIWPERERLWRGRSVASIPECRDCSIAGLCGGGCTFAALARHGSPNVGICSDADELLESYCRTLTPADLVTQEQPDQPALAQPATRDRNKTEIAANINSR